MPQHSRGLALRKHRAQHGRVGLLHSTNAAKMLEQSLSRALTHAGDFQEFGLAVAHLPALLLAVAHLPALLMMEGDGEKIFLASKLLQDAADSS